MSEIDWAGVAEGLSAHGLAETGPLIDAETARSLAALVDERRHFRRHVDMDRLSYGSGRYAYFAYPLPEVVADLRQRLYRGLAPLANEMMAALGRDERYPDDLPDFLDRCHAAGQGQATPLMLTYGPGGHNRLHRDLYGPLVFPFQAVVMLSCPEHDYDGGAFCLVENRMRQQSRIEAVRPPIGAAVVFPTAMRAVAGKRGTVRADLRHGVARVTAGRRTTLGLIFHDAEK